MSETTAAEASNPAFEKPLPVDNINDALPNLRRPFSPGAVRWKVQSEWPHEGDAEGAIIVGYIDARLVSARLNKVVGGNWSEKPVRVSDNNNALLCELTVFEQTHVDLGIGQGRTDEMRWKAVHSDALKRPAVRFGIGEPIYAMPEIRIGVSDNGEDDREGNPTIKRVKAGKRKGRAGYLGDRVEAYVRKRYEAWLEDHGTSAFGPVLDHGDDAQGSVGLAEEVDGEAEQPQAAEPLADEEAKGLIEDARKLRDEIRALDEDALAQQSFDNALAQREHSHDRLRDFVGNLTELRADVERFGALESEAHEKMGGGEAKKAVERALRRASRRERVESLEKAIEEAQEGGRDDA